MHNSAYNHLSYKGYVRGYARESCIQWNNLGCCQVFWDLTDAETNITTISDVQHNKVLAYYFVYLAIFIAYAVGTFLLGVEEITVDSIR